MCKCSKKDNISIGVVVAVYCPVCEGEEIDTTKIINKAIEQNNNFNQYVEENNFDEVFDV